MRIRRIYRLYGRIQEIEGVAHEVTTLRRLYRLLRRRAA